VSRHDRASEEHSQPTVSQFPEDLRRFVLSERWTFAKTMPQWPHEYLVRGKVDTELFERMVMHIRIHGYEGRFYRRAITYLDEGGFVYWTMGAPLARTAVINRCRREDTFEFRAKNGTLPESTFTEASNIRGLRQAGVPRTTSVSE